jgi:hypothetical protein
MRLLKKYCECFHIRKTLIFGLFFFGIFIGKAQEKYSGTIIIYPTYEDYLQNSGIVHEGDYLSTGSGHFFGRVWYTFKEKKLKSSGKRKKLKLYTNDIWGFKWGDGLYRISPFHEPMYVFYNGKVVYYEVCDFHISITHFVAPTDTDVDKYVDVTECVISEGLNTNLFVVQYNNSNKRRKENLEGTKRLLQKHPNGMQVFECLTQTKKFKERRKCILMLDE